MAGSIRMDPSRTPRLEEILSAAEELSTNTYYKPALGIPTEAPWILKAIYLYFLLHQYAKIPVFEEYRLESLPADQEAGRSGGRAIDAYTVALPYWKAEASRAVIGFISSALTLTETMPDIRGFIRQIGKMGLIGTNAYPFLRAAWQHKIHYRGVTGRIIQFGLAAQSRWMDSSCTDRTSAISAHLSMNKGVTNQLLAQLGFPVPRQVVVSSLREAQQAAVDLGLPVVVKPIGQDQGRGVSVGPNSHDEVIQAYELAASYGQRVLVEQLCRGQDYRLTVFEDRVVKVMHRTPLSVVGDGRSTIKMLLKRKEESALKERGPSPGSNNPYEVDDDMRWTLNRQGYQLADVPRQHEMVRLRGKANLSAGGSQELIPFFDIHPDNLRLAVSIAKLLRLDLCGIDLIIPDIRGSWLLGGCYVIEVNVQPQIGVLHAPEVYGEVLQKMLGNTSPSAQLVLDISAPDRHTDIGMDDTIVQQLCATVMSPTVVASSTSIWKDQQQIQSSPHDSGSLIEVALLDPTARSLLFIMSLGEYLHQGLPTHQIERIVCVTRNTNPSLISERLRSVRTLAPGVPLVEIAQ